MCLQFPLNTVHGDKKHFHNLKPYQIQIHARYSTNITELRAECVHTHTYTQINTKYIQSEFISFHCHRYSTNITKSRVATVHTQKLTPNTLQINNHYRIDCELALGRRHEEPRNAVRGEPVARAGDHTDGRARLLREEAHLFEELVLGDILGSLEDVGLGQRAKP